MKLNGGDSLARKNDDGGLGLVMMRPDALEGSEICAFDDIVQQDDVVARLFVQKASGRPAITVNHARTEVSHRCPARAA